MAASNKALFLSSRTTSPSKTSKPSRKTPLPIISICKNCQKLTLTPLSITNAFQDSFTTSIPNTTALPPKPWISRFAPGQPQKGADVLVEALERAGVSTVYAYPGSASVEIHQALTRSPTITNILCRHEQGEIFAAEGYARASGYPGVCIATSGPGATNLISGLADALHDSIPLIAITGQVPRCLIGTNAFQETPIVDVTRSITKHNYLVLDGNDIPRIVHEAFFLATSGRPGPVLIDIPQDILEQLIIPYWDQPMKLDDYSIFRLPEPPKTFQLQQILGLLFESRKPVLYVGGGCLNSHLELRRFVDLTGIPVASTLMGIGAYPYSHELSLRMLGAYGTVYANYSVDNSDLLLAFGVRFDNRVTGKLEAFATRAKIVHIDIDSREIGRKKLPHLAIWGDLKTTLEGLNALLEERKVAGKLDIDFWAWREELKEQKKKFPLSFACFGDTIPAPYAIQVLDELTNSDAIITTGVGQHQMWAAQWYNYKNPRQLITSSGLGAMGFGLPAAIGAAVSSPGSLVVDIDGDGSFLMSIQELATVAAEQLNVKMMVLNNQHLGMVVQWEDWYCKGNRGDTYLGNPSKNSEIFPDFLKFAEGCDIPAARITKKSELRDAILKMLQTPGPYLLDVIVSHQEHVFPIIPAGGSFNDVIIKGDGRTRY